MQHARKKLVGKQEDTIPLRRSRRR